MGIWKWPLSNRPIHQCHYQRFEPHCCFDTMQIVRATRSTCVNISCTSCRHSVPPWRQKPFLGRRISRPTPNTLAKDTDCMVSIPISWLVFGPENSEWMLVAQAAVSFFWHCFHHPTYLFLVITRYFDKYIGIMNSNCCLFVVENTLYYIITRYIIL